jgi:hypothetical protein
VHQREVERDRRELYQHIDAAMADVAAERVYSEEQMDEMLDNM